MESRNDNSIISYINHQSSASASAISRTESAHVYRNPISNPSQNLDQNHLLQHHQDSNPDPDPKPTSNSNGAPSNSKKPSSSSPPLPPPLQLQLQEDKGVRYRECLKNHAASMGTRVVDGCGEFMPNGEEGTPEALKCAACDCHRNFHRKEENGVYPLAVLPPPPQPPPRHTLFTMPPPPQQQHHHHHQVHHRNKNGPSSTPIMMNFGGVYGGGGGGGAESSSEDLNIFHCNKEGRTSINKKRFRTKFTQEQKEKMHEFAEKVGWKFQKQDEQELKQFCDEVGIKRQVLKVWMHNNKQAMKKKEI